MCRKLRSKVLGFAVLSLLLSCAEEAYCDYVDMNFRGVVTYTSTPLLAIGDQLDWSLTYVVGSTGAGSSAFSNSLISRYENQQTTSSATIGAFNLQGPVFNPGIGRSSSLQVEDGTPLRMRDCFQGSTNFSGVDGIAHPILAFYLYDHSGAFFGPNPQLPVLWNEDTLSQFDDRRFSVYDYEDLSHYAEIASGVILLPSEVPEPSTLHLMWSLLGALGAFGWWRRRRGRSW